MDDSQTFEVPDVSVTSFSSPSSETFGVDSYFDIGPPTQLGGSMDDVEAELDILVTGTNTPSKDTLGDTGSPASPSPRPGTPAESQDPIPSSETITTLAATVASLATTVGRMQVQQEATLAAMRAEQEQTLAAHMAALASLATRVDAMYDKLETQTASIATLSAAVLEAVGAAAQSKLDQMVEESDETPALLTSKDPSAESSVTSVDEDDPQAGGPQIESEWEEPKTPKELSEELHKLSTNQAATTEALGAIRATLGAQAVTLATLQPPTTAGKTPVRKGRSSSAPVGAARSHSKSVTFALPIPEPSLAEKIEAKAAEGAATHAHVAELQAQLRALPRVPSDDRAQKFREFQRAKRELATINRELEILRRG